MRRGLVYVVARNTDIENRVPLCVQLGYRFLHVLRRMLPIAMFLLQRDGQFLNGHDLFLKRVGAAYHAFLEVTHP
jgi:hypothetical protein